MKNSSFSLRLLLNSIVFLQIHHNKVGEFCKIPKSLGLKNVDHVLFQASIPLFCGQESVNFLCEQLSSLSNIKY